MKYYKCLTLTYDVFKSNIVNININLIYGLTLTYDVFKCKDKFDETIIDLEFNFNI